jgi:hypothetical protein
MERPLSVRLILPLDGMPLMALSDKDVVNTRDSADFGRDKSKLLVIISLDSISGVLQQRQKRRGGIKLNEDVQNDI